MNTYGTTPEDFHVNQRVGIHPTLWSRYGRFGIVTKISRGQVWVRLDPVRLDPYYRCIEANIAPRDLRAL